MKKQILILLALMFCFPVCSASAAENEEPEVLLPILMYHHIRTDTEHCGDYTVLPETFEGDLEYLKARGYETVSLQQLLAYENGTGTLPEKPVMITFDDGQSSFMAYAVPALEKYGMCAVMMVVGKFTDVYTESGDRDVRYCYLSWPDLAELNQSPYVELAAHSYNMHSLGVRKGCAIMAGESVSAYQETLNSDLALEESRFQEHLGIQPIAFAYPYGIYCDPAREVLQQRGYQVLFTCDQHVNVLSGQDGELLCLGRFNRPYSADRASFFANMGIQ